MENINLKSSDIDSFKYSVLISFHYYGISFRPERISKLTSYENKYNFSNITPTEFETDRWNISITIFDENNKKLYNTKNNGTNKVNIVQLKINRYAALKPLKDKFMILEKILKSFSHKKFKGHILITFLTMI